MKLHRDIRVDHEPLSLVFPLMYALESRSHVTLMVKNLGHFVVSMYESFQVDAMCSSSMDAGYAEFPAENPSWLIGPRISYLCL